jgi:hypothetical protein
MIHSVLKLLPHPIRISIIFLLFPVFIDCSSKLDDPQKIVDKAIASHGIDKLHNSVMEFDFREKHYRVTRKDGFFRYERSYTDSSGNVRIILSNDSIWKEIDGLKVQMDKKEKKKLSNGINAVVYFASLPYNLNDDAVNKRFLGQSTVHGESYYMVEITFRKEKGGRDYEDRFVYLIHSEKFTMDYFVYRYQIDGGGTRFREAINSRNVNGVRIQDYVNFKYSDLSFPIEQYDDLFEKGKLEKLSNIILKNVQVTIH